VSAADQMELARQLAAQAWCAPETSSIEMDVRLAEAFASVLAGWLDTAAQMQRNADFYRGIVVQVGELFGTAAKTSDDGSVQEDVLALKVPELVAAAIAERDGLNALINTPELDDFLRAVHIEAVHQIERWGQASDRAKRPADWFWLVGYLGGKALHAAHEVDHLGKLSLPRDETLKAIERHREKARHHCISTAAALYNWHCAIRGVDVRMCPGRSDVAETVDAAFPGEAPAAGFDFHAHQGGDSEGGEPV